ncbi:RES family NAD+ phosphorylase [Ciceribacter sp. RN22]|nr:RES family NAD+ phosphorylase [Ciceribacter sp. RN22]
MKSSPVLSMVCMMTASFRATATAALLKPGDDYNAAQAFANGLHEGLPDLDGIAYRARHNNGQICYALFDRVAPDNLLITDSRRFIDEHAVTDELMRKHNASWDPLSPLPPL